MPPGLLGNPKQSEVEQASGEDANAQLIGTDAGALLPSPALPRLDQASPRSNAPLDCLAAAPQLLNKKSHWISQHNTITHMPPDEHQGET